MIDMTGKACNGFKVLQRAGTDKYGQALWDCVCICGKHKVVKGYDLRNGYTTTCGCRSGVFGEVRRAQLIRMHAAAIKPEAPRNYIWAQYVWSAKSRNLELTLTASEFDALIAANCHWCGCPPDKTHTSNGGVSLNWSGIDRIDPAKGYIASNCVACCKICNMAKGAQSVDEFLSWVYRVYMLQNSFVAPHSEV